MLGFHLPSQSKKKLPMELNPRRGWDTVGVLAKTAREDAKKITEQKMEKSNQEIRETREVLQRQTNPRDWLSMAEREGL